MNLCPAWPSRGAGVQQRLRGPAGVPSVSVATPCHYHHALLRHCSSSATAAANSGMQQHGACQGMTLRTSVEPARRHQPHGILRRRAAVAARAQGTAGGGDTSKQQAAAAAAAAAATLPEAPAPSGAPPGSATNGTTNGASHTTSTTSAAVEAEVSGTPPPELAVASVDSDTDPVAATQAKPKKLTNFANRVLFGLAMGLGAGTVVLYGRRLFLALGLVIAFFAAREFHGFVTSKQIARSMVPPPPWVTHITTAMCLGTMVTGYNITGRSGTVLAVAAFSLLVVLVLTIRKPKFSQLTTSLFGLFYCGWLPSFWVKLRKLPTPLPYHPVVDYLPGFTSWTVGLLATFTSVLCIIAADTGAYFVGKRLGRTKLTDISPKKTVEGALGGLTCSVAVSLAMWRTMAWPPSPLAAALLGVLVFLSSLFGDLIESIMKRDAGMKDSGDLIPGHGGLLDRLDSYMFSGAMTYGFVQFILPVICPA